MIFNKSILPFYTKASIFFVGLSALLTLLYVAQGIIVPIIFALIIAILLNPVVSFFVRLKINRIFSILFTLIITVLLIAGFVLLIFTQASNFSDSWPVFVDKFTAILNETIRSASHYFTIKPSIIHAWVTKTQHELLTIDGALVGQTLVSVGSTLAILFIVPVYVFIILLYKSLLIEFVHRLFNNAHQAQITTILNQTKSVVQHYLFGLVIEGIIVAVLNSIGLLLLGIEFAILLGILGAILNVIPYLGGIIAVGLYMMVAIVTKESAWFALYVFGIHIFIQLIDNNYIVPRIVASKVKINALFSIIIVLVGNALWGIPGMFLSIPLLAILKVIFDHIETMKPWGFLLGDSMTPLIRISSKPLKTMIRRTNRN